MKRVVSLEGRYADTRKKNLPLSLIAGLLLFSGCASLTAQEALPQRNVVMIISHENFNDEEIITPKEFFESSGIKVAVASTSIDPASSMTGRMVNPNLAVTEVDARDYDAVIFVGGPGSSVYWDDPVAQKIAQDAVNMNRIVAAICIAPVTLANAGILSGKRATVWSTEAGRITARGAIYTGRQVERDGNIITASGPTASMEFAQEIYTALNRQ